ncbi:MAG: hypothetical protein H6540_02520 [Bacteroidales bacterium]|nr:hypothetical protein [Bacteroidales bacterium]
MDTTSSFLNELRSYRDRLAKPHLGNSAAEDFMKQEYERMKTELHAFLLLIRLDQSFSCRYSVAYNKIMDIRNKNTER